MMSQAHVANLQGLVDSIRLADQRRHVPTIDPLDGGVTADVLLLLEAPGKRAVETGFVSRDNPDPTADNLRRFLEQAGIGRRRTVVWNAVPWYLGEGARIRAATASDLNEASEWLDAFISLLPRLHAVVLVGRAAERAWAGRTVAGAQVWRMPHPSQRNLNADKSFGSQISKVLADVHAALPPLA